MARRFRARGIPVRDTASAEPVVAAPAAQATKLEDLPLRASFVIPTNETAPVAPAAPWPTQPRTIDTPGIADPAVAQKVAEREFLERQLANLEKHGSLAPQPTEKTEPAELTDDELERLTAPDGEG